MPVSQPESATPLTTQQEGPPFVRAQALDHVNLHVRDADASLRFYKEVFGLTLDGVERDAQGRADFVVMRAGPQNVFLMRRPEYHAPAGRDARGLNHICLEIEQVDPAQLLAMLRARGVQLRSELVHRQSDRGPTVSIYVEDLDGHGIELKQYAQAR